MPFVGFVKLLADLSPGSEFVRDLGKASRSLANVILRDLEKATQARRVKVNQLLEVSLLWYTRSSLASGTPITKTRPLPRPDHLFLSETRLGTVKGLDTASDMFITRLQSATGYRILIPS
jgi:hypothetical protein